jgi:hypothetical protein
MGTVLASSIMAAAAGILQDEGFVRFTEAWLFTGINYGQREVCDAKPDANPVSGAVKLAAGTFQALPAGGLLLLRISHNMGTDGLTPGRLITKVDLEKLGAYNPFFAAMDAAAEARHYAYDDKTPKQFAVIPPQPATGQGYVYMTYGAMPADLVKPAGSYDVAINLGDEYANALTYFAVYWGYAKDADFSPGARDRAMAWYELFLRTLGVKQGAESEAVEPDAEQHEIK